MNLKTSLTTSTLCSQLSNNRKLLASHNASINRSNVCLRNENLFSFLVGGDQVFLCVGAVSPTPIFQLKSRSKIFSKIFRYLQLNTIFTSLFITWSYGLITHLIGLLRLVKILYRYEMYRYSAVMQLRHVPSRAEKYRGQ